MISYMCVNHWISWKQHMHEQIMYAASKLYVYEIARELYINAIKTIMYWFHVAAWASGKTAHKQIMQPSWPHSFLLKYLSEFNLMKMVHMLI